MRGLNDKMTELTSSTGGTLNPYGVTVIGVSKTTGVSGTYTLGKQRSGAKVDVIIGGASSHVYRVMTGATDIHFGPSSELNHMFTHDSDPLISGNQPPSISFIASGSSAWLILNQTSGVRAWSSGRAT